MECCIRFFLQFKIKYLQISESEYFEDISPSFFIIEIASFKKNSSYICTLYVHTESSFRIETEL